jgi:putative phosphoesterase
LVRIGLVSDSHRALGALARAVERMGNVDAILHAGDETRDAAAMSQWVKVPVWSVAGNWDRIGPGTPAVRVLDDFGPRLLLTHGHQYGVKQGMDGLIQLAQQHAAVVAVYGHTHRHHAEVKNGVLVVNPGSCADPRGHQDPTCGFLDIKPMAGGWEITASVLTLAGTLVDWAQLQVPGEAS